MKTCIKCGEEKSLDDFYSNSWADLKSEPCIRPDCKDCYNKSQAIKRVLKKGFSGLETSYCECCGNVGEVQSDHDHNLHTFRGFVCNSCNTTLGNIEIKNGSMFDIVKNKPESVEKIYRDYYKKAIQRAGYSWDKRAKYRSIWSE